MGSGIADTPGPRYRIRFVDAFPDLPPPQLANPTSHHERCRQKAHMRRALQTPNPPIEHEGRSDADQDERVAVTNALLGDHAGSVELPVLPTIDQMVQDFLRDSARTAVSFNTPVEHIFFTPEQLLLTEVLQPRSQQPVQLPVFTSFLNSLRNLSGTRVGSYLPGSTSTSSPDGLSMLSGTTRVSSSTAEPGSRMNALPADFSVSGRGSSVKSLKRALPVSDGDSTEEDLNSAARLHKKPRRGKRVPTWMRRERWRQARVEEGEVQTTLEAL